LPHHAPAPHPHPHSFPTRRSSDLTGTMANLQESLSQMTGIDLNEMLENISGKGNFKQELGQLASTLEEHKSAETEKDKTNNNEGKQDIEQSGDPKNGESSSLLEDQELDEKKATSESYEKRKKDLSDKE